MITPIGERNLFLELRILGSSHHHSFLAYCYLLAHDARSGGLKVRLSPSGINSNVASDIDQFSNNNLTAPNRVIPINGGLRPLQWIIVNISPLCAESVACRLYELREARLRKEPCGIRRIVDLRWDSLNRNSIYRLIEQCKFIEDNRRDLMTQNFL